MIGFLQLATVTLFSVFFRRIYRTFLQVESRAAERDRLAALGTAASPIAHEVKNALNGLKAATALLDATAATWQPAPSADRPTGWRTSRPR